MLILHANWSDDGLRFWAEDVSQLDPARSASATEAPASATTAVSSETITHRFAASGARVAAALAPVLGDDVTEPAEDLRLRLPCEGDEPKPSDRLAAYVGRLEDEGEDGEAPAVRPVAVPTATVPNQRAIDVLLRLEAAEEARAASDVFVAGPGLAWWYAVARLAQDLLSEQRFVPSLVQRAGEGLRAVWQPWLHDEATRERTGLLVAAMPPQVRATIDDRGGRPWPILEESLQGLVDARVRQVLVDDDFADALAGRDENVDPHVAWLSGLLARATGVPRDEDDATTLMRSVADWLGVLVPASTAGGLRLVLRLLEPEDGVPDDLAPGEDKVEWRLICSLASDDAEVEAERLWTDPAEAAALLGGAERHPEEILVAELGRAARVFTPLETLLADPHPAECRLSTEDAHRLLGEFAELLRESGIEVIAPEWWGGESARLTARLEVAPSGGVGGGGESRPELGLASLVQYRWRIAIGDRVLTAEDVRALADRVRNGTALVRLRGRWVELREEEVREACTLLEGGGEGEMSLLEAVRLVGVGRNGLPVQGIDASGWVADLLGGSSDTDRMPTIEQPTRFDGSLRPYQLAGVSWLAFLDRLGLGACLADDMGLGKTIQLIALLQWEREQRGGDSPGPTLLIVPTSVVSNWKREIGRFAEQLRVHVQHGPDRPIGDRFLAIAADTDVIITTYTLISRDRDTLMQCEFHRVVLDEAQYIKNPPTKQTATIRALKTTRRVALTGTPVENRLSELWSIVDFCNPGYLGPQGEFRRRFALPIERHRDARRAEQLRALVRPFILRRVKTDPTVIDDLPECVTTREHAVLTPEQARMYERTVEQMLGEVGRAEGIKRRGLVLSTLVRLKQICNHPAQAGDDPIPPVETLASRSGKCRRIVRMLEEVVAADHRALIFTQFRKMGDMLVAMLQHELDTEVLFLHGGTPAARRQEMVDRFQAQGDSPPIFVLSLRAGGIGLNLTAANHVFHFDRWWNPAVENQATDRAFRIGQTRTVQVHKFICEGTLEERIDRMIERKTELAENIIGAGEDWLTELSTGQLRDLLTLRRDAVEEGA